MTSALKPLTGVCVLDFSRVLAGPFCTQMLADLGADVIKIEHPVRGDDTRWWGPPFVSNMEAEGISAYYMTLNRNKRSLGLNLKDERGLEIARQLATDPKTNIMVENFKVGGMASFGLDYESLSRQNPSLVYCSITGFGQTGPYKNRPGYDIGIQGMSGLMDVTGMPEQEPQKVGVAICDVLAGLNAANGIQAALRHAEKTGIGQHVDISLLDVTMAGIVNLATNYLVTKVPPKRIGNANPTIVPYQAFAASNGHFIVACGNNLQFASLARLLGRDEWAADERFSTNPARVKNRKELATLLGREFAQKPVNHWVSNLLEYGIPASPINDLGQALEDPHVRARGMVQNVTFHDENGVVKATSETVGSPLKLSKTQIREPGAPPYIGQHTNEILQALGLGEREIESLRHGGVIR